MKRKILIIFTMLSFSVSVFAINSTLDVKGGVQYPKAPGKIGFDSAASLNIGVDKYFTVGAESGFGWVNWTQKSGYVDFGNVALAASRETNMYTIPLLATAKIRLADMMESYGFMPYVTGGAGYSWTWYNTPDKTTRFGGFTWETLAGIEVKLGSDSSLAFVVEAGYRGAEVKNSGYLLDMSGFVGRVGISFPIETSD